MSNETKMRDVDPNINSMSIVEPVDKIALLAEEQGVRPVSNFNDLLGDFWPEDESADEFIAATRDWNQEGAERIVH